MELEAELRNCYGDVKVKILYREMVLLDRPNRFRNTKRPPELLIGTVVLEKL